MKVKVYAKLNLSLNVYPVRGAFHPIDSVVTSVDVFDAVSVVPTEENGISVTCNADIPSMQNSAYCAAVAFRKTFETGGYAIDIKKGIPMGAGMGGSSADAAAVVYCLCKLNNVPLDSPRVHEICADIGSDVNFMLWGGFAHMTGKGDDVQWLSLHAPLYFALTTFSTQISTAQVYSAFDNLPQKPTFCDNDKLVDMLQRGFFDQARLCFGNNLQPAACSVSCWAQEYLGFCAEHKISCTMTGSGSAFFVPFNTKSEATAFTKWLNCHGFTTQVCRTVPHGIKRMIF